MIKLKNKLFVGVLASLASVSFFSQSVLADYTIPAKQDEIEKETSTGEVIDKEGNINGDAVSDDKTAEDNVVNLDIELKDDGSYVYIKSETAGVYRINVGSECNVVKSITITTKAAVDGRVIIKNLDANGTNVELKNAIGYCNFEVEGLNKDNVEKIDWKMKANREKLTETQVNKDNLKLMNFKDNKWNKVDTKREGGDSEFYFYTAQTQDFSDGKIALAEVNDGIFTKTNLLYCGASLIGLAVLLIIGYFLLGKREQGGSSAK